MAKSKKVSHHLQFSDETKVHPALKEYFGHCLTKIAAKLKQLQTNALSDLHVQIYHLGMLKVLMIGGPISQIQLGDELGIDKASMVKAIDELEKLKYLQRVPHPTDRRVKLVELTSKGEALLKQCNKSKENVEKEFFKGLDKKDEEKFREIVRQLAELHSAKS